MTGLRPYQTAAVDAVFEQWKENDSTLLLAATGTGKTQIFCEVIRRLHPQRSLVLAHREELIFQAVKRLESFGLEASIEMADLRASTSFWNQTPVVVATIQSLLSGNGDNKRLDRFKPEDYSCVIVDEAHHAVAPSYRKILDHFHLNKELRLLGVTATPDRADELALGQVFKSVAYEYDIRDAIMDGYLVPIEELFITVDDLDLSHVRTTAGDLNGADLAAVMEQERVLHEIASPTIQIIGEKTTLVFTSSVRHAELLSEIFNRHRPGMSEWVSGKTPKDDRRAILKRFAEGKTQVVCNCAVLGEGFDEPSIAYVVMGRPTKSRSLFSQMVGRSTRPLTGVIDELEHADDRKQAIAQSGKPNCTVIDFVGNTGRHRLIHTGDLLGGKASDEVLELALSNAKAKGKPVRMDEEIAKAEHELMEARKREEAARRARLVGKARFSVRSINPFELFDITPVRERGWDSGRNLSEKQTAFLAKQGINPEGLPYAQAQQIIGHMIGRFKNHLSTPKQCELLRRFGFDAKTWRIEQASAKIDAIAKNGWRVPPS